MTSRQTRIGMIGFAIGMLLFGVSLVIGAFAHDLAWLGAGIGALISACAAGAVVAFVFGSDE
jgi:hypothetical protein